MFRKSTKFTRPNAKNTLKTFSMLRAIQKKSSNGLNCSYNLVPFSQRCCHKTDMIMVGRLPHTLFSLLSRFIHRSYSISDLVIHSLMHCTVYTIAHIQKSEQQQTCCSTPLHACNEHGSFSISICCRVACV